MKKVIILQGKEKTGKTSTLKMVVNMLLTNKARLLVFSNNFAKWILGNDVGDIWAIMEYKGEIIFINTAGDYSKIILEKFNDVLQIAKKKSIKIDVYIGAIHDTPLCKQAIAQIEKNLGAISTVFVTKTEALVKTKKYFDIANINDSNEVFSKI